MQSYILWPPLLAFALRRQISRQLVFAAPCLLAFAFAINRLWLLNSDAPWHIVYSGSTAHSGGLLIGSALALFSTWQPSLNLHQPRAIALASLGLMLGLVFTQDDHSLLTLTAGFDMMALGTAVIVLYVTLQPSSQPARPLGWRSLAFIEAISYPLYLWHVPIHTFLRILGFRLSQPDTIAVGFALSFLMSFLTYRCVERPIARLRSRLTAWRYQLCFYDTLRLYLIKRCPGLCFPSVVNVNSDHNVLLE